MTKSIPGTTLTFYNIYRKLITKRDMIVDNGHESHQFSMRFYDIESCKAYKLHIFIMVVHERVCMYRSFVEDVENKTGKAVYEGINGDMNGVAGAIFENVSKFVIDNRNKVVN